MNGDVAKAKIENERQLELEFADIQIALKGKEVEENWEQRDKAINRLAEFTESGSKFSSFCSLLKTVFEPLLASLSSLRTQIVISACHCIEVLSDCLKADFDPFLEATISIGVKNSSQTKKVALNAISSCVRKVISNTSSIKHLGLFHASLAEKNAGLRARVSEFALATLKCHPQNNMVKSLDLIDKIIQKTITDASHEVRQLSKEIFAVYSEQFPTQAENLLSILEPQSKKHLTAAKSSSSSIRMGGSSGAGSISTKSRISKSKSATASNGNFMNASPTASPNTLKNASVVSMKDKITEENSKPSLESPLFKTNVDKLKKREPTLRLEALDFVCNAIRGSGQLEPESDFISNEYNKLFSVMLDHLLGIFSDTHFLVIQALMDTLSVYTKFLCSNQQIIPFALDHIERIMAPTFNILFDSKYESVPGILEDSNLIISDCMQYLKEESLLSIVGNIIASSSWWRKPAVKRALLNTLEKISMDVKSEFFRNKQNYRIWINKLHPSLADPVPEIRASTVKLFNFLYDINPRDYLQIASTFEDSISSQLLSVSIVKGNENENTSELQQKEQQNLPETNLEKEITADEATPEKKKPLKQILKSRETINLDSPSIPTPIKRKLTGDVKRISSAFKNESQLVSAEVVDKFKNGIVDFGIVQKLVKVSRENDASIWTRGLVSSIFHKMFPLILSPDQNNELKESLLIALKNIILNQTELIVGMENSILRCLVKSRFSNSFEVCAATEDCVDAFIQVTEKTVCLSSFFQLFTDKSKVSTVGYFYLSRICRHFPATALNGEMGKIVPYLLKGFESPFAETRKAVVDCLVEIHQVLRDDLFSFMKDLSIPQKKLLVIYIERSNTSNSNSDSEKGSKSNNSVVNGSNKFSK